MAYKLFKKNTYGSVICMGYNYFFYFKPIRITDLYVFKNKLKKTIRIGYIIFFKNKSLSDLYAL